MAALIESRIGRAYRKQPEALEKLLAYRDDEDTLRELETVKRANKPTSPSVRRDRDLLDPDSSFDVQVKRLHEYKRQLLNVLKIVDFYLAIKDNPALQMRPQSFIFGAKAAAGYYLAKDIIRLSALSAQIEKAPGNGES